MIEADTYFQSEMDALEEARRRRASAAEDAILVKVEPSGYGGYVVRSVPVELELDPLLDPDIPTHKRTRRRWAAQYG